MCKRERQIDRDRETECLGVCVGVRNKDSV